MGRELEHQVAQLPRGRISPQNKDKLSLFSVDGLWGASGGGYRWIQMDTVISELPP
jgi:hypothetical protein